MIDFYKNKDSYNDRIKFAKFQNDHIASSDSLQQIIIFDSSTYVCDVRTKLCILISQISSAEILLLLYRSSFLNK